MEMTQEQIARADHDLLIRLDTKMDRAGSDMQQLHEHISTVHRSVETLNSTIDTKVAAAVAVKLDREDAMLMKAEADKIHDDHEKRIRKLEKYVWAAIGALAILQIGIAIIK